MRILISFATETGTAEEYARRVAREARARGLNYAYADAAELTLPSLQQYDRVIFVISTTGEGEMPRSMTALWLELLQRALPSDYLAQQEWAILALGDSSYERYNWAGKKLHRRIEQLGARMFVDRADGDDQSAMGIEDAFAPCIAQLWSTLGAEHTLMQSSYMTPSVRAVPAGNGCQGEEVMMMDGPSHSIPMTICANERITSEDHFQDTRHIVFRQVDDIPLEYKPGDVAVLLPVNPPHAVDQLLELLHWEAQQRFSFTPLVPEVKIPVDDQAVTPKTLLSKYLDIYKPPKRFFFRILAEFAMTAEYREKLMELSSTSADDDIYGEYVWRPRRTAAEVLADFSMGLAPVPVDWIFDMFPPLRAREYSISSSSRAFPGEIHLTAALVEYRTSLPVLRRGVCSQWLRCLSIGETVQIGIRSGNWIVHSGNGPVVMMAAGTGIAPMRALIHHLCSDQQSATEGSERQLYLFFGCRYLEKDFYYAHEWQQQCVARRLTVFARGSRNATGAPRTYLSDIIRENGSLFRRLLDDPSAVFYLAGNSKLPASVKSAMCDLSGDNGLPARLIKDRRFFIECWSV
jgi:sulfite reductase alpha subunit-like flavoprotein